MHQRYLSLLGIRALLHGKNEQTPQHLMESITIPVEDSVPGLLAEIKQISVTSDDDVTAVNALLAEGWKIFHIGHTSQHTVYVLGKPPQQDRRRTGFAP